MSEKEITRLFCDYVTRTESRPRHTAEAEREVDVFDQFCADAFPHDIKLHIELLDRMMNVAVEFEESGFIAGFKTAMRLFCAEGSVAA